MPNLREQLQQCFQGNVCLMGLGNALYGDDGFGVRLAEELKSEGRSHVIHAIIAGTTPERFIGEVADEGFDHIIFLDAVEFGGAPGSVVLLSSDEITARYPQISTHKISLGLLAKWVEANGTTKASLLGVQPESLKPGRELTPAVRATLELLRELVQDASLVGRAILCAPRGIGIGRPATPRRPEDCAAYLKTSATEVLA